MDKKELSAVVLAGGESIRMGTNKALLKLGSKTMIEKVVEELKKVFDDIIVVTNIQEQYSMIDGVRFVKDCVQTEKRSSLIGLYTGLSSIDTKGAFVVPCDMPFLNKSLILYMINKMQDEDVIIPYMDGHYQPLHAIYKKTCLPSIKKNLDIGEYKVIKFFSEVNIKTIGKDEVEEFDKDMKCFININTYKEYIKSKEIIKRE